eukprot:1495923-Pyramimonas_sp.AAC.1
MTGPRPTGARAGSRLLMESPPIPDNEVPPVGGGAPRSRAYSAGALLARISRASARWQAPQLHRGRRSCPGPPGPRRHGN